MKPSFRSISCALALFLFLSRLHAADADREVALWALRMGGSVTLEGSPQRIRDVADLPDRDFRIVVLNMVATNMHPPHMEQFGKLTALRELYLPGPMWNPRAESRTHYSETLEYLNGLTTLKKLEMSYTFLETMHILDVGLDKMQGLGPTLEELVLRRARLKGMGLQAFTNLRSLDLTMALVTDEGMQSLSGMTKLRKLFAGELRITDKGVKPLADLQELEELSRRHRNHRCRPGESRRADQAEEARSARAGHHRRRPRSSGAHEGSRGPESLSDEGFKRGTRKAETLPQVERGGSAIFARDLRRCREPARRVAERHARLPRFLAQACQQERRRAGCQGKSDKAVADWVQSIGGKAMIENGSLVKVSLNGTPVNDDQLKTFAGRRGLRSLILDNTEIGDLGVQNLAGLTGLTELSLSNTGLSDAGLAHIARLTNLESCA